MEQETKRCPYCGQEIKSTAKKCRFCGKWLDKEFAPSPVTVIKHSPTERKPKRGKGLLKILIPVLALVVLGGVVGCFFYDKYQQKRAIILCEQGYNFEYGYNGVTQDYSEAAKCYRESADKGYAPALYWLSEMYRSGFGVEMDKNEAERLYKSAVEPCRELAEKGDAMAQCAVGFMRLNQDQDIEENYSEALEWFRKSAEQGYASAQYQLGWCYFRGYGVEENYTEAVKWWKKAAEQGDENAKYVLDEFGISY